MDEEKFNKDMKEAKQIAWLGIIMMAMSGLFLFFSLLLGSNEEIDFLASFVFATFGMAVGLFGMVLSMMARVRRLERLAREPGRDEPTLPKLTEQLIRDELKENGETDEETEAHIDMMKKVI